MTDTEIDRVAERYARRFFNAEFGLPRVVDLVELLDLKLIVERTTVEQFSGLIRLHRGYWILFINGTMPARRRLWTIAHECGHWIIHRDQIGNADLHAEAQREYEADRFAAGFLVPAWLLRSYASSAGSVRELAARFKVSTAALTKRLSELNMPLATTQPMETTYAEAMGGAHPPDWISNTPVDERKVIVLNNEIGQCCPKCGVPAKRSEASYCRYCGTPLTNRCVPCDVVLEADEAYCEFCGAESYFKENRLVLFAEAGAIPSDDLGLDDADLPF